MHTLIIILFILAFSSFVLQLSLINKKSVIFGFYVIIALSLYFLYPYAIEQSYAKFQQLIQNHHTLSNFMVIQIIECLSGILFSIFLIRMFYKEKIYKIFRYFNFFPGIVIFPALFYSESAIFLNITGFDFKILAIIIAILVPVILFSTQQLLNYLVPEYDLRLELKFIVHILQLVVAIIISIKLFRLPTANLISDFYIEQLFAFFGLVIIFALIGLLKYRRELRA